MEKKQKVKKPFPLWAMIVAICLGVILSVGLIVGTVIAYGYQNLIDVFFSSSDYSASEVEKETCADIVAEGAVLLKNDDNALPLAANEKKIALFGQNSVDFVYAGSGSGNVDTSTAPTLKSALESPEHGGFTVDGALWSFYTTGAGKGYRKSVPDMSGVGTFGVNEVPVETLKSSSAASGLSGDDVAIVSIGRSGGESADLPTAVMSTGYRYLQVDGNERDTIKYACEKFDKVILIVNANNPVELGFLDEPDYANVKAAIWVGGVGQEGLNGLADIICGNANPSGRLADTYAYDSTSAPATVNFGNYTIANADGGTKNANKYLVFGEGIYVGYRYYETRYEDVVTERENAGSYDYDTAVQFPFGYGLSYTSFEWSDYSVTPAADGKSFEVSVKVTNTGSRAGKDVVEIFAQAPYIAGGVEKSSVVLAGFKKTGLIDPQASETVTVTVDKSVLASYDYEDNKTYILDPGTYYISAGKNAHDALNNILAKRGMTPDNTDNRMTAAGNANMVGEYSVAQLDKTYATSKDTGNAVTNRFDDGSINHYDADFKYVSRNDWQGTLPSAAYQNGSWTAPSQLIEDLKFYRGNEVVNDDSLPALASAKSYTVQDLVDEPYESEKWDQMVSSLSWTEISKLVRIGGYSTMQIEKIGLPSTQDKDGPAGISGTLVGGSSSMAWPAEVVMASTWNDELIEKMGELLGQASIITGVAGWYAPGVNIHRTPYSGRNYEYFSEDGILSGKICAAEMRGVRKMGVMAYMKHFALNDQEVNRYGAAIFANEQEIREICLKGFELAVTEGGATAAMAAMNRIGARWVGAHRGLMTDVLRGEWGFKGMVITDQASSAGMYYQDMISGLWAGTDLWLNTNANLWPLANYDESTGGGSGKVSYKDNATVTYYLHRAAKNIIYSVTNSNAVQSYSDEYHSTARIFNWRALLISIDVLVWVGSVAAITLTTLFYVRGRKKLKAQKLSSDTSDETAESVSVTSDADTKAEDKPQPDISKQDNADE